MYIAHLPAFTISSIKRNIGIYRINRNGTILFCRLLSFKINKTHFFSLFLSCSAPLSNTVAQWIQTLANDMKLWVRNRLGFKKKRFIQEFLTHMNW